MLFLELMCEPLPNPSSEGERDRDEIWARIDISVVDGDGTAVRSVLSWQWNARELVTWLLHNRDALLGEALPNALASTRGKSIAECVHLFYAQEEGLNDDDVERVFAYRSAHGLRFGMRGTDVPEVYVGLGEEGSEISAWDESGGWRHLVDLQDFLSRMERIAEALL